MEIKQEPLIRMIIKKYPTLQDANITIKKTSLNFSARTFKYPFVNKYVLEINQKKVNNLTRKEMTGMVAHEMAHFEQYRRDAWMWLHVLIRVLAFRYIGRFDEKYSEKIEKEADRIAIKRGFGKELLAHRRYLLKHQQYFRENKHRYLSPEEIKKK